MAEESEVFFIGGRSIFDLRVVDLKKELDKRCLLKSGSKKDLLERLRVHLQEEKASEEAVQEEERIPKLQLQGKEVQNEFVRRYFEERNKLSEKLKLESQKNEDSKYSAIKKQTEEADMKEARGKQRKDDTEKVEKTKEGGWESGEEEGQVSDEDPAQKQESSVREERIESDQHSSPESSDKKGARQDRDSSPESSDKKGARQDRDSSPESSDKKGARQDRDSSPESSDKKGARQDRESSPESVKSEKSTSDMEKPESPETKNSEPISQVQESESIKTIENDVHMKDQKTGSTTPEKNEENVKNGDVNKTAGKSRSRSRSRSSSNRRSISRSSSRDRRSSSRSSHSRSRSRSRSRSKSRSKEKLRTRSASTNSSRSSSYSRSRSRSRSRSNGSSRSRSRSDSRPRSQSRNKSTSRSRSRSRSRSSEASPRKKRKTPVSSPKNEDGEHDDSYHTAHEDSLINNSSSRAEKDLEIDEKLRGQSQQRQKDSNKTEETYDSRTDQNSYREPEGTSFDRRRRKRKWGTTRTGTKRATISISTESLKGIIPEIKASAKDELVLDLGLNNAHDSEPEEKREVVIQRTISQDVPAIREEVEEKPEPMEEEERHIEEAIHKESAEKQPPKEKTPPVIVRRVSRQQSLPGLEEPQAARRSPSPARNPASRVVEVRNLVRPFTLGQLKQLLGRTGSLVDGAFWIDKIKSHCLAAFETEEEANATRLALHGTRWPSCNPKILRVDFATLEELESYQSGEIVLYKGQDFPPEPGRARKPGPGMREIKLKEKKREVAPPVREWDRDKARQSKSRSRSREKARLAKRYEERERREAEKAQEKRDRERRKSDRSRERKERRGSGRKEPEEPPAKLLDDLFRKTKTTPCIYWLALTQEQIVKRDKMKAERELERERKRKEREKQELAMRKQREKQREEARMKARVYDREQARGNRRRSRSRNRRR